jgi:hypothetical protein
MRNLNRLIADVKKTAKENGFKVKLTPHKRVKIHGGFCSGYFDGHLLVTAAGPPETDWVPVFVHESCHMDQAVENDSLWDPAGKALEDFDSWISYKTVLTEAQQFHMIETIQDLERDCEKRTIKKIKKYNLPIDIDEYGRLSNIYLYSYEFMRQKQRWLSFSEVQHKLKKHVKDKIQKSHIKIPFELYKKFEEYLKIDPNKKAAR